MTHSRKLAAKLSRDVVDHIESTKSIIVQNIEEVIHDALLLDGAKQDPSVFVIDPIRKHVPHWGSLKNWWQGEMSDADHAAWMRRIEESDARAAKERQEAQRRIRSGYSWAGI